MIRRPPRSTLFPTRRSSDLATGCRVEVTPDPTIHEPMKPNGAMAALFERNLGLIGFSVDPDDGDRKSTRLNSSHGYISYAVFCLKKKKNSMQTHMIKGSTL